ncbi:MAG TPA: IS91 family transposase [Blastocatellia bacterium]|nr:IS91 family transposase [Blastocatellia bacterium]HMG35156.1 IS91 family transposase [Blastocatellia bacterium]
MADVFKSLDSDTESLSCQQRRVIRDIIQCRTAALGGHVEQCTKCGHQQMSYNSCRNRHCPKCRAAARKEWMQERAAELLPVEYFHVVFTLPEQLSALALQNKRVIYGLLFRAASQTLLEIAADPRRLGAAIGFLAVLHTWGQTLQHHPHLHCVIPGGGLSLDRSRWVGCRKGFFLPVKVLSRLFRGKFVAYLRAANERGRLAFHGQSKHLGEATHFADLLDKVGKLEWVVYAKPPFGGPVQVLKYLARYTHRVAISNQRLIALSEGQVTFRWKDYADGNAVKEMTLDVREFTRRFLLHILPRGFVRIRHYGFLANRSRSERLDCCRKLLTHSANQAAYFEQADIGPDQCETEQDLQLCPVCREGRMKILKMLEPEAIPLRANFRLAGTADTS